MKINTALILCAGFGKRLNPITLKTPKPLLKIKDLTLLEYCINLIKRVGVNKIFINSFYLKEQINKFIEENNFEIEIKNMIDLYFKKNLKNVLLLVYKELSFDKNLKGDFDLNNNLIIQDHKNYIYTGCQILNKSIFKDKLISNFSISEIWLNLIKNNQLYGLESKLKFYHATDLETFNKLQDL